MRAAAVLPFIAALSLVAGCNSPASYGVNAVGGVSPYVKQGGPKPITWVQFAASSRSGDGIVVGPDKDIWFPSPSSGGLAQMTMTGSTTILPVTCFGPNLTVGGDGNFYSGCGQSTISQVSSAGVEQDYSIPSGDQATLNGITAGPDGNVWFVENEHIGRITPGGFVSEQLFPSGNQGIVNSGITTGSDGKLWFTESPAHLVGSVDPNSFAIVEYNIPSPPGGSRCDPDSIVSAPDGNLYFDCAVGALGQMSPTSPGNVNYIIQPWGFARNVQDLAIGPDKGVWFISNTNNIIGEYNYLTQTVTGYIPPQSFGAASTITAGPDGNIWTNANTHIDVYVLKVLTVNPKHLTYTTIGQVLSFKVTEVGTSHWTAQSSNTSVATVTQGGNARTFNVTATGSGKCVITVSDAIGNLINVKVTVP